MSFFKKTIRDVPLDNKTVLLRADYNVPLGKDGSISDDLRIRASLPTIQYLLERGCKVVIISHLGRPEGRDKSLSLEPIAQRLAHLLKRDVRFVNDCIGDRPYQAVKQTPNNGVIFEAVMRGDLSLLDFLDADFTYLNKRPRASLWDTGDQRRTVPTGQAQG